VGVVRRRQLKRGYQSLCRGRWLKKVVSFFQEIIHDTISFLPSRVTPTLVMPLVLHNSRLCYLDCWHDPLSWRRCSSCNRASRPDDVGVTGRASLIGFNLRRLNGRKGDKLPCSGLRTWKSFHGQRPLQDIMVALPTAAYDRHKTVILGHSVKRSNVAVLFNGDLLLLNAMKFQRYGCKTRQILNDKRRRRSTTLPAICPFQK